MNTVQVPTQSFKNGSPPENGIRENTPHPNQEGPNVWVKSLIYINYFPHALFAKTVEDQKNKSKRYSCQNFPARREGKEEQVFQNIVLLLPTITLNTSSEHGSNSVQK